ncbi:hypothetical protein F5Y10DRAFT_268747 [Nemania abortiva]|nr:hypothetical protein F5Y10DRAFT_268747 [Nemania abortiva]
MPLLKDTLATARGDFKYVNKDTCAAATQVLNGCKEKLEALESIFKEVMVAPEASRLQRYGSAIRTLGKGRRAEDLVDNIVVGFQLLTTNYTIRGGAKVQSKEFIEEMQNKTPVPLNNYVSLIENYGTGIQTIYTGASDQNINIGSGK